MWGKVPSTIPMLNSSITIPSIELGSDGQW